jgi:hypothetical protein
LRIDDALAALLVASPGSGPPGSPNLSPRVFGRAPWSTTESFEQDFKKLTLEERAKFRGAVAAFVADIKRRNFRKGLRVKGIRGAEGIFEMTWAKNGRATFQYGPEALANEPHVIWRRCGTHAIFRKP